MKILKGMKSNGGGKYMDRSKWIFCVIIIVMMSLGGTKCAIKMNYIIT